jgi:deferrochelatase/peroxidase EfeB
MKRGIPSPPLPSRRAFLISAAGAAAAAGLGFGTRSVFAAPVGKTLPFFGLHQAGIVTPAQGHIYFAAFDLDAKTRDEVRDLMKTWTVAADRLTLGRTARPLGDDIAQPGGDTADVMELKPARLTVTFGFGPGLFTKDNVDRYGLAAQRPAALVDMPKFPGDQLVDAMTGGDLCIQACADDPQVVFHAVRELARLAEGVASIRWVQAGFVAGFEPKDTPRNLMGFKDGTDNPPIDDPKAMDKVVWVGSEGPEWMRGGTYAVYRKSRMALEHWDRMKVGFQEETFGRHKYSGAPLGATHEHDALPLDLTDKDGNPVVPENSHVRLSSPASNDGFQILRRSYSYNDGADMVAERWPPWHQGMEYDAGLLFVCFQKDPRTGFINIFNKLSRFDMMNQFVTNIGSGLFACPPGAAKGGYIGQKLFEA